MRISMRWFNLACLLLLTGCWEYRQVTVTSRPPDSVISIDGQIRGQGQVTQQLVFRNLTGLKHTILVTRHGYLDQSMTLVKGDGKKDIELDLRPPTRHINVTVLPVAGVVSLDGLPEDQQPVPQIGIDVPFIVDENGHWPTHTVMATRVGFRSAQITVGMQDETSDYILQLQPMKKDLSISTTPPGAEVYIDGQDLGVSPVWIKDRTFNYDTTATDFIPTKVHLTKAGYDPVDTTISWDEGKTDYSFPIPPKTKAVRIITTPGGATVTINGQTYPSDMNGVTAVTLPFVPTNDNGDLPTYTATVTKKTADSEWYPQTLSIPWDNGKSDYSVDLKEIKTKHVSMLSLQWMRDADGMWQISPLVTDTLGAKALGEAAGSEPAAMIYAAPAGYTIDSLSVSPNGSTVVFSLLSGKSKADLRSQILAISSDGTGGVQQLTDGKTIDVMPSCTPDGAQVVFASNRAGRRLNLWRKSLSGYSGIEQLTNTEEQDLWPTVDAAPRPRLFYEALSDSQADPQLYVQPIEGGPRLDLANMPVDEPSVSPRADSVIFTSVNQRTNNREIYRISDHGGPPEDLTNDPDSDCYDPAWSRDGSQIAYVSSRGVDEDKQHNPDIWVMDLSHPDHSTQITTNASIDDRPVWDPTSSAIYFRSNRGGRWGIWKINVK